MKKISQKAGAYLELMRLGNCIIAGIAVLIGFFLASGINYLSAALAFISAFLICAGGQAINDYFDRKIDSKLSKQRPIPSKRLTAKEALYFSLDLFILGVGISVFLSQTAFIIAFVFALLLFCYPAFMNKIKYLGNIVVALGTAFTFVYGSASAGTIIPLVVLLAASAFFSNMAREVTKDIEDLKKDKGVKVTLPMKTKKAKHFVSIYYAIAIILGVASFALFRLGAYYLLFTLAAAMVFIYSLQLLYKNKPHQSQNFSKRGMLVSLAAFILAGFR